MGQLTPVTAEYLIAWPKCDFVVDSGNGNAWTIIPTAPIEDHLIYPTRIEADACKARNINLWG